MKLANRLVTKPTKEQPTYAHYDASIVESIVLDGGTVAEWLDISGNNRNIVNYALPTYRPSYTAGQYVSCINKYLSIGDSFTIDQYGAFVGCIIAVSKWASTSGDYRHFLSHASYFHGNTASSGKLFNTSYCSSSTINSSGLVNGVATTPSTMTRFTTTKVVSFNSPTSELRFLGVGGFQGGGYHTSRGFNGTYSEILVYVDPQPLEKLLITHTNLMQKWLIT